MGASVRGGEHEHRLLCCDYFSDSNSCYLVGFWQGREMSLPKVYKSRARQGGKNARTILRLQQALAIATVALEKVTTVQVEFKEDLPDLMRLFSSQALRYISDLGVEELGK